MSGKNCMYIQVYMFYISYGPFGEKYPLKLEYLLGEMNFYVVY